MAIIKNPIPQSVLEAQREGRKLWGRIERRRYGPNDVDGQGTKVYGSHSSIHDDLEHAYFEGVKAHDIKDFHIWSTYNMETVVILVDFDPPLGVGTRVDFWTRKVEVKTDLYYWEKSEIHRYWGHYDPLLREDKDPWWQPPSF